MIRTIVVDDEPYLRQSIKRSIETINSNFVVIAEAGNGVHAYKSITELEPDVVFLDIRMPVMDGIALLEKLSHLDKSPICVILTGYSEFEYAKKALQYKVFDYILKPIHIEDLTALLDNIATQIFQKKQYEEYQYFNSVLKGVKPQLPLKQLIWSLSRYKNYGFFYVIAGSYMYIKNNQFNPTGGFWNDYHLSEDIKGLCSCGQQVWFIPGENQNEMLIIVGNTVDASPEPKELANYIYSLCTKLPFPITMTYYPEVIPLESLKNVVIDLKYHTLKKIGFGYSALHKFCKEATTEKPAPVMPSEVTESLKNHIKERRYNEYKRSVKILLNHYKMQHYLQYELRISLIRILEILQDNFLSDEIQNYVEELITNTYSYTDIWEILMQYIDDYSKDYYHTISANLIDDIKDYIDEHYTEQLALKYIASHFHISPSYLSTLFKKST